MLVFAAFDRRRRALSLTALLSLFATLLVGALGVTSAFATHIRGASLTWTPGANPGDVVFNITWSERADYPNAAGSKIYPAVGSSITFGPFLRPYVGGPSFEPALTVQSVDKTNDVLIATGQYTYHYNYNANSPGQLYTASLNQSSRLSTLLNNHDTVQNMNTVVQPYAGNSTTSGAGSPVSTLPPIVDCGVSSTCNFFVPASDPARRTLTYRMATGAEMSGSASSPETQPPGASVDGTTGLYSFTTTPQQGLWSTQVVVESHSGGASSGVVASTAVDFLIRVSSSTTNAPPAFDGSTPADGSHVQGSVGNPLTVPVHASDPNSSDVVTLSALGLPSGATLASTPGNPVAGSITFTPTVPGQFPVNLVATDQNGATATRSVVLDIAKLVPHISWAAPAQITYGTPLGSGQLDASTVESDATGSITYFLADGTTPADGAVLDAGSGQILVAKYVPDSAAAGTYAPTTLQTTIDVAQAPQTITVDDPGTHTYGDPAFVLSAHGGGSHNPVTFAASTPAVCTTTGTNGATVTIIDAGDCEVVASQAGNADYADASPITVPITVAKATPHVTWALNSPDNLNYGMAIGAYGNRLVTPAGVTGTVGYTLADGTPVTLDTVLNAGDGQIVNGTFTPTGADAANYTAVTVPLTVNVAKVAGPVTLTAPAQEQIGWVTKFGVGLGAFRADAPPELLSLTPGVCTTTTTPAPAVFVVHAGDCQIQGFDTGNANYYPAQSDVVHITILKGQPVLNWGPVTQHVTYGDPLEVGEQLDATVYAPPATPAPSGHIDYTILTGVPRNAVDATPQAGTWITEAHFVPDAAYAADWNDGYANVTFIVDRAVPVIDFPGASTTYGTALRAGHELAATVDVSNFDRALAGTFTYTLPGGTNAVGATPDAGDYTVTATFTPAALFSEEYTTATVTAPLHVDQAAQTITFGPIGDHHFGDAPFTVTATGGGSGNNVVLTPTSGSTCTTQQSDATHTLVTVTGAGGCQLTATQAGNGNYLDAAPAVASFTSDKEVTSLTWGTPDSITYGTGVAAGALDATLDQAGVHGTIAYTEGGTPVEAGDVLDAGDHVLTATFTPADQANYYGTTANVTLHVDQARQIIGFAKPDDRTYGDPAFTVTATGGGSHNPVTFGTSTPSVCAVTDAGHVTILGAGACIITADEAGSPNFLNADPVSQTFTVARAPQAVHVTDPGAHTFGDEPFALSATGGDSHNPVTFTSNTTGVCVVEGATVTILHAGDCTITASQAGTANYAAAPDVPVTFTVGKATQALALASIPAHVFGDPSFDVAVTPGGSSAVPQLALRNGDPCTLTGTTVEITGAGSCQVTATQAGDADWKDATPVVRGFTIAKATPSITWTDPTATTYGDQLSATQLSATVTPSTIAGGITYTDGVGNPVHVGDVLHAGDHVLTATFAPSGADAANWNPASTTATVTVNKAAQTITFAPVADHTYGDPAFTVTATGGDSHNPVTFGAAEQCTAVGDPEHDAATVTLTGAGSCALTANQAGTDDFNDAPPVTRSFGIAKATPKLAWTTPAHLTYGDALGFEQLDAQVVSTGVTGSFAYTLPGGGDAHGVKLDAGSYQLTATFTPDAASAANWQGASTQVTVTVDKADQQLGFPALPDRTFGDGPLTLTASKGGSGEPVTFTAAGDCTVTSNSLTITHAGSCAVTANEDGNGNWNPSPSMTRTFTIAKADQVIGFVIAAHATFGDDPFALTATGGHSGNPVTFTATGAACSVTSAGTVTVLAAGSCDISADQAGNGDYNAAPTVTRTLVVDKEAQQITFAMTGTRTFGDAPFTVTASATSGLPVGFTAAGACKITSTTVTITGVGVCSVTAHQAGNGNWAPASDVTRSVDVTYGTALGFDNTKASKAGSTIPVKVMLTQAGKNISAAGITLGSVTLDGQPAPYPGTSQAGETFTYMGSSSSGGYYQFNVKTDGLSAGAHTLGYTVSGDPDVHTVTLYIR